LWNTPNGLFLTLWNSKIKIGIEGQADIMGIRNDGKFIAVECKVGRDFLKPEQIKWAEMIKKYNGVWIQVRTIEDMEGIFK